MIGRVADLSVYVCRADYTHKVEYTLINELAEEKKLPNLCLLYTSIVTDFSDFSIAERSIDYDRVNNILNRERKKSIELLGSLCVV